MSPKRRHELTDGQWGRTEPLLPPQKYTKYRSWYFNSLAEPITLRSKRGGSEAPRDHNLQRTLADLELAALAASRKPSD